MSRMIQIRNVPDDLHDYLLREVRRLSERASPAEIRARLLSRSPVEPGTPTADVVRAGRDGR